MRGISFVFVIMGVISAILGMIWGIQMSASQDHSLAPAHGHLNLLGWVSCMIYGFYYHLVPGSDTGLLPKIHLGTVLVALGILVPGIALAIAEQTEILAQAGSVLYLLSTLVFATIILRGARSA